MKIDSQKDYFDFVYCYHVIEHINKPAILISKITDWFADAGILYIGTPNKNRLFDTIGLDRYGIGVKVKSNFNIWKMKIMNKFESKKGVHAGFTSLELLNLLKGFASLFDVSKDYYFFKYKKFWRLIKMLYIWYISNFIMTSNYFLCVK